ncbi:MAG: hypothetical protein ACI93V_001089 [Alteromonadaceae bacterium]|jgi:hypothetical protein
MNYIQKNTESIRILEVINGLNNGINNILKDNFSRINLIIHNEIIVS